MVRFLTIVAVVDALIFAYIWGAVSAPRPSFCSPELAIITEEYTRINIVEATI